MEDYSTAVLHNVHEFASGITFGASLSGNSIVQYNFLILASYSKSHRILKHLLYPRDAVLNTLKFIRPETTCTKSKEEPQNLDFSPYWIVTRKKWVGIW